ncbi:MAG: hypothetical protein ACRYFU_25775 [Janthinobacterium lividum]
MAHLDEFKRAPDRVEQNVRVPDEYEAGHQARVAEAVEFKTATNCWRAGLQKADRELAGSGEPAVDRVDETAIFEQWNPYGTGQMAQVCELPLGETRAEPWKRSWIQADLELGLAARLRHG